MDLVDNKIYVAGCDPIIRSFNLENGHCDQYVGHKGWIYTIVFNGRRMFSGGDDR